MLEMTLQAQGRIHTQDFGENENQNHANEKPGLLSSAADTSITNDTNRETSGETRETHSKTSAELNETCEERVSILVKTVGDQDGNDEAVDTNDTSHNNGDDVCIAGMGG